MDGNFCLNLPTRYLNISGPGAAMDSSTDIQARMDLWDAVMG